MNQSKEELTEVKRELASRIRHSSPCSTELIDKYYTLCIPIYREFLGNHWHTGFYLPDTEIGFADQLRMEMRIAESASMDDTCKALDVGCGIGGPAVHLSARTGAQICGITPNRTQLDHARTLAQAAHCSDLVQFERGFADDLEFPEESFDIVYFFESPCHFSDRNRFFREALRVLKPGGRLVGEDWLAGDGLDSTSRHRFIDPICKSWAIPSLGSRSDYVDGMLESGFDVQQAVDLQYDMPLHRGFAVAESSRNDIQRDLELTTDPIRKLVMEGLLLLGDAVIGGAFTVGQFLAVKKD